MFRFHNPSANLAGIRSLNLLFPENRVEQAAAQDLFGDAFRSNWCQSIDSDTADKRRSDVNQDMMRMEIDWVTIVEATVHGSELGTSAVLKKDGRPKSPDLGEPIGDALTRSRLCGRFVRLPKKRPHEPMARRNASRDITSRQFDTVLQEFRVCSQYLGAGTDERRHRMRQAIQEALNKTHIELRVRGIKDDMLGYKR